VSPVHDERRVLSHLDDAYLLASIRELMSEEIVAGTPGEQVRASSIADEMRRIGLRSGLSTQSLIESFPLNGWREICSSLTVIGSPPKSLQCRQCYEGRGTGPEGVGGLLVSLGNADWEDLERVDMRGRIVLFHRASCWTDAMGGLPILMEAESRGAVGAVMDTSIIRADALRSDPIMSSIPAVHITQKDAVWLESLLAAGQEVRLKLVIDNEHGYRAQGWNVVGMIPGIDFPDEYVYMSAHHDHWFEDAGASDDCAGVATLLAIARAMVEAGLTPKRTLVFCAWGAEERGGPDVSAYDWCVGSCSHIAATLRPDGARGPALHPDRVGRIVAMLNMDEVGSRGGTAHLQATPDLTECYVGAAIEMIGPALAKERVSSPAAYDNWPFYTMGVPCANIAWRGAAHDAVIHTPDDTVEALDLHHLQRNMAFNAALGVRLACADLVPYSLSSTADAVESGVKGLVGGCPEDGRRLSVAATDLFREIAGYRSAISRLNDESTKGGCRSTRSSLNARMMAAAAALNPHLYRCDLDVTPGWTSSLVLEQSAKDIQALTAAIARLRDHDRDAALASLAMMTTMSWGQRMGTQAYGRMLDLVCDTPFAWWAEGFIPRTVTVHAEYRLLHDEVVCAAAMLTTADALAEKREHVMGWAEEEVWTLSGAFEAAARELRDAAV
jgi:hypothetical protein